MKKPLVVDREPTEAQKFLERMDRLEETLRRVESLAKTNYQMAVALTSAVGEISLWAFGRENIKPGEEIVG